MKEASKPIEGAEDATRDPFEVAAYWHGLFEDGQPEAQERERFEMWLASDPRNRASYESVERTWNGMANAGIDEQILAMRREALAAPSKPRVRWIRPVGIAAAMLAGTLVAGMLMHHSPASFDPGAGEFATQVGQRSSIVLADGSTVMLNTASRIKVAFTAQDRRVHLLAGQAWFEVAKNQPRPFIVEAGDRMVTAHGTAFDVRLEGQTQVQITLVEGRVSVDALERGAAEANIRVEHEDLLPGDQLMVTGTQAATKHSADLAKATSWREGQIIFDDDTLANAVTEVNRYSATKIVIADPRLSSLRMSGVFIAGHSE